MPKITRCKFKCDEVSRNAHNAKVKLSAVHDAGLNNEDSAFCTHTPAGTLEMNLYPVDRADFFIPGKAYFIDIQAVPEA
jgi:hypothetical protein